MRGRSALASKQDARATHPVLGEGVVGRWARLYKRAELRLDLARLRAPRRAQRFLDPLLDWGGMAVRRSAATLLFFRGELRRYAESEAGDGIVGFWSPRGARLRIGRWIWPRGSSPSPGPARRCWLGGALREIDDDRALALSVVMSTTACAPMLRRRGFRIVPDSVRWTGRRDDLEAALERPAKSLAGNLALARRSGYRWSIRESTPELGRLFWERYLVPHAQLRFGADANVPDRETSDRLCRVGHFLIVKRDGMELPAAMALIHQARDRIQFLALGTLDAEPELTRSGAQVALYEAEIRWALERGFEKVDFGRSLPYRRSGIAWFKWQWGLRPEADRSQVVEAAIRLGGDAPVARRFLALEPLVREGNRISVWRP